MITKFIYTECGSQIRRFEKNKKNRKPIFYLFFAKQIKITQVEFYYIKSSFFKDCARQMPFLVSHTLLLQDR